MWSWQVEAVFCSQARWGQHWASDARKLLSPGRTRGPSCLSASAYRVSGLFTDLVALYIPVRAHIRQTDKQICLLLVPPSPRQERLVCQYWRNVACHPPQSLCQAILYICISRLEGLFTVELSGSFSGPNHFKASLGLSVWGVSLNLCAQWDGWHLVPFPCLVPERAGRYRCHAVCGVLLSTACYG